MASGIFDDIVMQWIMSLGPEVYVKEPKRLRDMVKAGISGTCCAGKLSGLCQLILTPFGIVTLFSRGSGNDIRIEVS